MEHAEKGQLILVWWWQWVHRRMAIRTVTLNTHTYTQQHSDFGFIFLRYRSCYRRNLHRTKLRNYDWKHSTSNFSPIPRFRCVRSTDRDVIWPETPSTISTWTSVSYDYQHIVSRFLVHSSPVPGPVWNQSILLPITNLRTMTRLTIVFFHFRQYVSNNLPIKIFCDP